MFNVISHILLLLCFLTVAGYAQGQTKLTGVVKDNEGNYVPLANIVILSLNRGTFSGKGGFYELPDLPTGEHTITVSHVSYETRVLTVTTNSKQKVVVMDVKLVPLTVKMPGVIITGEVNSVPGLLDLPLRSHRISIEEIAVTPAISTQALLGSIPGIHISSESGIFSSSDVNIRGIAKGQTGTLVIIDGIPANKSDGGSVNWNIIDKDLIANLEIIKGPGSALFGSNAMGGVINILSTPPDGSFSAKASLSYGTFNTSEGKILCQGGFDSSRYYWKAFFHYRNSDGYINTPKEIILENDSIVVPVYLNEKFAGATTGIKLKNNGSLELSVNFFEDIRGRGTRIYESAGSNTTRHTWQHNFRYFGDIKGWKSNLVVYSSRENYFRLNEYYSDGEYKLYEVDSKRDDIGCRMVFEKKLTERNELITGAESRIGKVKASDIYYTSTDIISNNGTLDIYALFLQFSRIMKNPKWKLVAGLRYDYARFHDASFSIKHPSYSIEYFTDFQFGGINTVFWHSLNPKLIIQYKPFKQTRTYFTLARGFRAPVLDDLCRSTRTTLGLRMANPALRPENIYNIEAGIDQSLFGFINTGISMFYTLGDQFMHLLSNGDSVNLGYTIAPVYQTSNISKVNIYGVETEFSIPFKRGLRLYGNYTFNKAVIDAFNPRTKADPDLTGKYLTNIPDHSFTAGINVRSRWVDISVSGKYTGRQWIRDDNGFDNVYLLASHYEPFFTLDAKALRTFGNLEASIDVENILNAIYINSRGYLSPGRMLFLKLRYTLTRRKSNYE